MTVRPVVASASVALAAIYLFACTPSDEDSLSSLRSPIVYGAPDYDHPSVVMISAGGGGCSGTLISKSIVLTARHCLEGTEGDDWWVSEGRAPPLSPLVRGAEVVLAEDVEARMAEDIALLITREEVPLEPYLAAYDLDEDDLLASEVTVVGYGQDERGRSGFRQRCSMTVTAVHGLNMYLEGESFPSFGDSGGAILDADGFVIGVISRGGEGGVIVGRVDTHRWFLDPILRREGGCVPGDPEVCDGVDNNCDGEVDPGCASLGEPCESSDECVDGTCESVAGESICTLTCDPWSDEPPCWDGSYCWERACGDGWCRNGTAGERPSGEACRDDQDCASLTCRAFGTDEPMCTVRCQVDSMACAEGEVCAGWEGECGGCVPMAMSESPRGMGEPCSTDEDCREELTCIDDPPGRYCSRSCHSDEDCPDGGMYCRVENEICVRGERADTGGPCVADTDCERGVCWTSVDGATFCTEECRPNVICPARFSCDFENEICVPWDAVLGQLCGAPEEEIECLLGECLSHDDEERCAEPCDRFCATGFECIELDAGSICWPFLSAEADDEGCDCSSVGRRRFPRWRLWSLLQI